MIYCHFFCHIHLIIQIWFTNIFLSFNFLNLGSKWLQYIERHDSVQTDPLVRIFPRLVKCNFHKFGFSGTLEVKEALCFLPLNIVNEKMFIILWFWFLILFVFSLLYILHDFCFFVSPTTRLLRLQNSAPQVNPDFLLKVSQNVYYSFVLELIAVNMKPSHFNQLITYLIKYHFDKDLNHLNRSVFCLALSNGIFKSTSR